jgi:hypothetical protein
MCDRQHEQVDLPAKNGFDVLHPRQTQTICANPHAVALNSLLRLFYVVGRSAFRGLLFNQKSLFTEDNEDNKGFRSSI